MPAWVDEDLPLVDDLAVDPVLGSAELTHGVALVDPFVAGAVPVPATGGPVFLLGAAGGCGVSTISRLAGDIIGEGIDPERVRGLVGVDVDSGFWGGIPYGAPTWVVASVAAGPLRAAQAIASRYSRGLIPVEIVGLVLTYPPYRPDREEVGLARNLTALFPTTVAFHWLDDVESLTAEQLPKRERTLIQALLNSGDTAAPTEGESL